MLERFEVNLKNNLSQFYNHQWIYLYQLFTSLVPQDCDVKSRRLFHIFFLDLLNTYRGWRHSKGLPVRGQRTWTNSQSTYKSNLTLRLFKVNLVRRLYGNVTLKNAAVAYMAEQVNLLWKLQWAKEWSQAKKRRLQTLQKKRGTYKVDLYSMAKGQVVFSDLKKSTSKKKKKKIKTQSTFLMGFDPGFTKMLIRRAVTDNYMRTKRHRKVQVILGADTESKKKKIKKKIIAKPAVKKKKKSNWE